MRSGPADLSTSKKWLREASLQRLSRFVKTKTELIDHRNKLMTQNILTNGTAEQLEKSGLNEIEIYHISQWVYGFESGRHCLLAILDSRNLKETKKVKNGNIQNEFKPVDVITKSIHLPLNFLCDSGYIYEAIFNRSPIEVIKEALQLLSTKALEKSSIELGIEQINIAIKQLKLDCLCSSTSDGKSMHSDNLDEFFKLQIMIELIRMHIQSNSISNQPKKLFNPFKIDSNSIKNDEKFDNFVSDIESTYYRKSNYFLDDAVDDEEEDEDDLYSFPSLKTSGFKSSMKNVSKEDTKSSSPIKKLQQLKELKDRYTQEMKIFQIIEEHLTIPIPTVTTHAQSMTADELEQSNTLLKPYLKQLSSLKAILTSQLKELQESRAFLHLGITEDADDDQIKRAYRMMAIRLHPDKPGGDTVKFQKLQDSYQEIIKKRKSDKHQKEAMEEARGRKKKGFSAAGVGSGSGGKGLGGDVKERGGKGSTMRRGLNEQTGDDVKGNVDGDEEDEKEDETAGLFEKKEDFKEENLNEDEEGSGEDVQDEVKDEDGRGDKMEGQLQETIDEGKEKETEASEDVKKVETKKSYKETKVEIEDAEDEEEEEDRDLMKGQTSSFGFIKETLKTKQPRPFFQDDHEHVQYLSTEISNYLTKIRQLANQCASLAQLNLKWQKRVEKLMEDLHLGTIPSRSIVRELSKIISKSAVAVTNNENGMEKSMVPNAESCSLQHAILPVELICELTQKISSFAMEMTTECGSRYALEASTNRPLLSAIEQSMKHSLNALQSVVNFIGSEEQISSCFKRVQESLLLAYENDDVCDLLIEMVLVSIKNNVLTISSAVNRVVDAAISSSDISNAIQSILVDVEADILSEARRKADVMENDEWESEFSEEDREAIRKSRMERQPGTPSPGEEGANKEKDASEKTGEEGKALDPNEDPLDTGIKSLDQLRNKIRTLQVQLKVQHVQALQTLNKDTLSLQSQILQEIESLPFISSWNDIFDNTWLTSKSSPLSQHSSTSSSSTSSSSSLSSSSSSSAATISPLPTQLPQSFRHSLLSLLADFVDGSFLSLKTDMGTLTPTPNHTPSWLTSTTTTPSIRPIVVTMTGANEYFDIHFGWMKIIIPQQFRHLSDQQKSINFLHFIKNSIIQTPLPLEKASSEVPALSSRLALPPDFRSKILVLASIMDAQSVSEIITVELMERLVEVFQGVTIQQENEKFRSPDEVEVEDELFNDIVDLEILFGKNFTDSDEIPYEETGRESTANTTKTPTSTVSPTPAMGCNKDSPDSTWNSLSSTSENGEDTYQLD